MWARRTQRLSENFPPRESRNFWKQGSSQTAPERAVSQGGACSFPVVARLLDRTFINSLFSLGSLSYDFEAAGGYQMASTQVSSNDNDLVTRRLFAFWHYVSLVISLVISPGGHSCHSDLNVKGLGWLGDLPLRNVLRGYLRKCTRLGGERWAGLLCISLLSRAVGWFCRPCRDQSCRQACSSGSALSAAPFRAAGDISQHGRRWAVLSAKAHLLSTLKLFVGSEDLNLFWRPAYFGSLRNIVQVDVEIGSVCNWLVQFHAGKQLG